MAPEEARRRQPYERSFPVNEYVSTPCAENENGGTAVAI